VKMILVAMFSLPLLVNVHGELNEQFLLFELKEFRCFKGSAGFLGFRRMARSRSEEVPHMKEHITVALKQVLSKAAKHVCASMEHGADPSRDVVRLFVGSKSPKVVINI
jgi:hypothetical protein